MKLQMNQEENEFVKKEEEEYSQKVQKANQESLVE